MSVADYKFGTTKYLRYRIAAAEVVRNKQGTLSSRKEGEREKGNGQQNDRRPCARRYTKHVNQLLHCMLSEFLNARVFITNSIVIVFI